MTDETWLDLLRNAHLMAGVPSLRKVSKSSGVSVSAVHQILAGASYPKRETLFSVATALASIPARDEIMAAYDARITPTIAAERERDAQLIANAISEGLANSANAIIEGLADIANAIRGLRRDDL